MAVNHFADKTADEWVHFKGLLPSNDTQKGAKPFPYDSEYLKNMEYKMPDSIDYRILGAVTSVKGKLLKEIFLFTKNYWNINKRNGFYLTLNAIYLRFHVNFNYNADEKQSFTHTRHFVSLTSIKSFTEHESMNANYFAKLLYYFLFIRFLPGDMRNKEQ